MGIKDTYGKGDRQELPAIPDESTEITLKVRSHKWHHTPWFVTAIDGANEVTVCNKSLADAVLDAITAVKMAQA